MLDDITIKAIQDDIQLLDPNGTNRQYHQSEHRRLKRVEYNRRAYIKRRYGNQPQRTKSYYQPVVQSPDEHDDVDYDLL